MKNSLADLFSVFKREVKLILSDFDLIVIILLSPILYSFFYTTIYSNKTETNVPIEIVDLDNSELSKQLIRNIDAHQLVDVAEVSTNFNSAVEKINSTDVQGIIFIPNKFEASLKSNKGSDLKIYLNTSRFLVSNDINKAVNEVIGTFNAGVKLKYFETQSYNFEQAKELIEPVRIEVKSLFNPNETYGDFLIPGLLVLILQQTFLLGFSESIAKEREENSLGELFLLAKKNVLKAILGKGFFYLIMFSSLAFLFFTLHFTLFEIPVEGSIIALASITIIFLLNIVFFCAFIASFFKKKITSIQVVAFTSYPLFLISGYSWPIESMPFIIRIISQILPGTPYLNAFNRIVAMGAGFENILPEFFQLVGLLIFWILISSFRMKKIFENDLKFATP